MMLFDQQIENLPVGKHHDGGGTGLFLRVDANGGRFWIQRIVIHGKRREIGLGGFPVVGLAEARKAALANKQLAYSGGDPLAEKKEDKLCTDIASAPKAISSRFDFVREEYRQICEAIEMAERRKAELFSEMLSLHKKAANK
jgi:hypothetical protein